MSLNIHNSSLLVTDIEGGGIVIPCGVGIGAGGGVAMVVVVVNGCVVCRIDLLLLSFCSISCN